MYSLRVYDKDPVFPWREISREMIFKNRVIKLSRRELVEESDALEPARGHFSLLEPPDWVNIVAITADKQLVLIEQWRHGVDRVTLEIPGGMVDPGEAPESAAQRELAEETGFTAEHWHKIGVIEPNPALQSNRCHTYLATNAELSSRPQFDGNERCRLILEPYEQADALVSNGRITHALVAVALYFARLHYS